MKYKFNNHNIEFTDPTIEFVRLVEWDMQTKIGSVEAILTVSGAKYGVLLDSLSLPTVNEGTITAAAQQRLQDFVI